MSAHRSSQMGTIRLRTRRCSTTLPLTKDACGNSLTKLDAFHLLIQVDEISRVNGGAMTSIAGASVVGAPPIIHYGTEEQNKRDGYPACLTGPRASRWESPNQKQEVTLPTLPRRQRRLPMENTTSSTDTRSGITGTPWATHDHSRSYRPQRL